MKRGEVVEVNWPFSDLKGSKNRPALVIQADFLNGLIDDTILVQINPRERPDRPRTANEVLNRLNEISFNSPLMKELRMIALLRQVADAGTGEGARWAQMRTHRIMTDMLLELGASSKVNAEWDFMAKLRDEGQRTAGKFLDEHGGDVGKRSTADFDALLDEC